MREASRLPGLRILLLQLIITLNSITLSLALPSPVPDLQDGTPDAVTTSSSGNITVFDPVTNQLISQGAATDGAGSDFNIPAVLWIIAASIVGVPLAVAGMKGGRLTSGVGVGLALALAFWASIINTVDSTGVPDFLIFLFVVLLFGVGLGVGFLTVDYAVGSMALGAAGGLSIGMRAVLLREGLLVPIFFVNWIIVGLFGLLGSVAVVMNERMGVIVGSASAGTFLIGLGIDLFLNKQLGVSRGLRFLSDRNSSHLADILSNGYTPSLKTQIIIGASLGLIPILVLLQHKLFPGPFWVRARRDSWFSLDSYDGRGWICCGRRKANDGYDDMDQAENNRLRKPRDMEISRPLSANPHYMKSRFSWS